MKFSLCFVGLIVVVTAISPKREQVLDAIVRARQTNDIIRDLSTEAEDSTDAKAPLCPMAKYHGRRASAKVLEDENTNDLLLASKLLKEAGFSDEELRSTEVVTEFRQLLNNCQGDQVTCDTTAPYRTADGYCNNLQNPSWGAAGTAQVREIEPAYDDGVSSPRTRSVRAGESLPNARLVSNAVHVADPEVKRSRTINLQAFQFGQFLDHDIIATPIQGAVQDCCMATSDVDNCFPIRIEWEGDPNPNFPNGYCMNFPRSAPQFCPTVGGQSRREQINELTSFIDASNVYGSSLHEQTLLREGAEPGFLATNDGGRRLPNNPDESHCFPNATAGVFCSLAGDIRVNEIPTLTSYHTLFVREHNRIASRLRERFRDGERLFQETRKIVIAIMQKITYDEYLASFLGQEAMREHKLSSSEHYRYDPAINPAVSNDFGIAYRMGHTWIPRTMGIFDPSYNLLGSELTENTFFKPDMTYYEGTKGLGGLAMFLSSENSTATDRILEDTVRNNLFLDDAGNSFDLAALNIQRGRDHGLPPYTAYRKLCNLGADEITRFSDLVDHDDSAKDRLKAVYGDARDIDMFTGALSETPRQGSSLGPTMECILGRQFHRLKYGDRFWYQGDAARFTPDQRRAINKYSMAKVLCNNYNFRTVNWPNAFSAKDRFKPCKEIPQLDMNPFLGGSRPPRPSDGGHRREKRSG